VIVGRCGEDLAAFKAAPVVTPRLQEWYRNHKDVAVATADYQGCKVSDLTGVYDPVEEEVFAEQKRRGYSTSLRQRLILKAKDLLGEDVESIGGQTAEDFALAVLVEVLEKNPDAPASCIGGIAMDRLKLRIIDAWRKEQAQGAEWVPITPDTGDDDEPSEQSLEVEIAHARALGAPVSKRNGRKVVDWENVPRKSFASLSEETRALFAEVLTPSEARVMEAYCYGADEPKDIAFQLGITPNAARKYFSTAKAKLREWIPSPDEDPAEKLLRAFVNSRIGPIVRIHDSDRPKMEGSCIPMG